MSHTAQIPCWLNRPSSWRKALSVSCNTRIDIGALGKGFANCKNRLNRAGLFQVARNPPANHGRLKHDSVPSPDDIVPQPSDVAAVDRPSGCLPPTGKVIMTQIKKGRP